MRQRIGARAEQARHVVEEEEHQGREGGSQDHVEDDRVSQDPLRLVPPALSQANRDEGGRARADERSEGDGEILFDLLPATHRTTFSGRRS
jgi:hypothetical protein